MSNMPVSEPLPGRGLLITFAIFGCILAVLMTLGLLALLLADVAPSGVTKRLGENTSFMIVTWFSEVVVVVATVSLYFGSIGSLTLSPIARTFMNTAGISLVSFLITDIVLNTVIIPAILEDMSGPYAKYQQTESALQMFWLRVLVTGTYGTSVLIFYNLESTRQLLASKRPQRMLEQENNLK